MSYYHFWRFMTKKGYAYLYDQFGEGPRHALYLPDDIRGLADDPYRSLAWMVRKEGGYHNSDENFTEFRWANFFRKKKLLDTQGRRGFHLAIQKGLSLAKKSTAKKLPGFIGPDKKKELEQKLKIKKSAFVPSEKNLKELSGKN